MLVCVRIKPPKQSLSALSAYALDESANTLTLTDTHPNVAKRGGKAGREREYVYTFDQLHLPPHETTVLYERHIASLVDKAMAGFNSTIFAYGQTGSGKTHTMSGTEDEVGVIPLAVSGVFEAIEQNASRHYLLRVSYLEIYNETLRDILNFSKKTLTDHDKPAIHLENVRLASGPLSGLADISLQGEVSVRPLTELIVRTPEDVIAILKKGQKNRKTGATDWNERSSRSHCVFTIVRDRARRAEKCADISLDH